MINARSGLRPAVGALVLMVLCASGTALYAQRQKTEIITRQDDPLTHDPLKPNVYDVDNEVRNAKIGKEVESALQDGNEAFAAQPPRYDAAERAYQEALKINPKEARAYVGLGQVYAAQNRVDDTLAAYQKAVELKPKFAEAHFNLGVVYFAIGRKDEARAQYEALQNLDKSLAKKLKNIMDK
jgi:tetratricopeptide (TPR) repeat protein